ncbi:MAG: hypothetical protein IJO37_07315 [Ruminiclostridium sp.]|nr:hypothetical protein [Ruminiclostridium sp.]
MKQGFGYIISFVEEIFFMGFVTLIIGFIAFDLRFSMIVNAANRLSDFVDVFFGYMLISAIGYPVILLLCILCQKFLGFYNGEYQGQNFAYILARDLFDDVAFPFYLLVAVVGVLLNKKNGDSKFGTILSFVLWMVTLSFILVGFRVAF